MSLILRRAGLALNDIVVQAVEWVTDHQGTPLLVLQREDHVKFGFGASGRANRSVSPRNEVHFL